MDIKLQVSVREPQAKLGPDFIPAVLYGPGVENKNLSVKLVEAAKVFETAGESNLIELIIEGGQTVKVLIKDFQKKALNSNLSHLDFYQVDMKKEVTAEIPLHFIGESKAVKELGGMLVKNTDAIEVTCLPDSLVDHIDIDVSVLVDFHQSILLRDLKLPKGMEFTHHDLGEAIVTVMEPRAEEAPAPVVAPVAAAPVKTEEKKEEKK